MKKAGIMLALLLCLLFAWPAAAQQTEAMLEVVTPEGRQDYVQSLCYVGDTLYLLGSRGIYVCDAQGGGVTLTVDLTEASTYFYMTERPEDEQEAALWEKAVRWLFTQGDALYALHPYSGQILRVESGAMEPVTTLPQPLLAMREEGFGPREILGVASGGDTLYLLLGTDDWNEYEKRELIAFDMATQTAQTIDVQGVQAIAPAGDGILLLISGEGGTIMRLAGGELTTLAGAIADDAGGIAWNEPQNTAVLLENGCLYAAGGQEALAYVPVPYLMGGTPVACSASGMYAIVSGQYVFLRDIASGRPAEKTVVRVMGMVSSEDMVEFSIENPDIAVVSNINGDAMLNAALTGDSTADVFILDAPGDFATFADKGYLLPLEDETLRAWIDTLYPAIAQAVVWDGSLLAAPINVFPNSWMVDETMWQALELGDYPEDYDALYACIAHWLSDMAEDNPDYTLSDIQQLGVTSLVTMLTESYILQYEQPGETLSFDTPVFRHALESAAQNSELFSEEHDQWGMPILNSYNLGFGVGYTDSDRNIMLLPPALTPGGERRMSATVQVMAVHSASAHPQEAARFVVWMTQRLSETTRYEMTPGLTEPVENPRYASRMEEIAQDLEALRAQLEVAEDADAMEDLEMQIAHWENVIANSEDMRYEISPEAIALYREVAEQMTIPVNSAFLGHDTVMSSLYDTVSRICGDGFSAGEVDALIAQLERVVNMAAGEQ